MIIVHYQKSVIARLVAKGRNPPQIRNRFPREIEIRILIIAQDNVIVFVCFFHDGRFHHIAGAVILLQQVASSFMELELAIVPIENSSAGLSRLTYTEDVTDSEVGVTRTRLPQETSKQFPTFPVQNGALHHHNEIKLVTVCADFPTGSEDPQIKVILRYLKCSRRHEKK